MFGRAADARVHVFPLGDNAVGAVAGLAEVGVRQARPRRCNVRVGIQKLLIASWLHSETHRIESGHRLSPLAFEGAEDTQPAQGWAIQ